MVYSYLRGGSRFLLWICGSGEVGELIWRGDLGSSTGALGVLDSKGQENPIGIGTGHRLATDFSNFVQKRGTQNFDGSNKRRGSQGQGVSRV